MLELHSSRIGKEPREELLAPYPVQPRKREKTPPAARAEVINSIATDVDRRALALEIQQVCGAVPLTEEEDETFAALREMRERHARNRPADLRAYLEPAATERAAAYASLLGRLPCTHCAARTLCPAAHGRRVN